MGVDEEVPGISEVSGGKVGVDEEVPDGRKKGICEGGIVERRSVIVLKGTGGVSIQSFRWEKGEERRGGKSGGKMWIVR